MAMFSMSIASQVFALNPLETLANRPWCCCCRQLCCVLQEQKQAALDKVALQAEMRRVVQAKDSEIQGLLADKVRLDAALASIKGQVTSAASPARSDCTTSKPSVRASVDSQTLR